MYNLWKKINDVRFYFLYDQGSLFVVKTQEEYVYRFCIDGELINEFTVERINPVFLFYNDHFYYSDYDGNTYMVNVKTKERSHLGGRPINVFKNDGNEFLIQTVEENYHAEIVDITTLETLWQFEGNTGLTFFSDSHFYCTNFDGYDKLYGYEKGSYRQVWVLDVSNTGEWVNNRNERLAGGIVNIIGIWNGLLLLHVTRNKILAVNSSGEIEWEIDNFLSPEEQVYFPYGSTTDMRAIITWLLNEKEGKLYLWGSHYLIEFDLSSRIKTILKDYTPNGWFFRSGQLKDNYISFAGSKSPGYPDHIGIYDLSKNEVVWDFKGESFFLTVHPPAMQNDLLYIKEFKDMVYVFKKS